MPPPPIPLSRKIIYRTINSKTERIGKGDAAHRRTHPENIRE
jgi:hypothetical protein